MKRIGIIAEKQSKSSFLQIPGVEWVELNDIGDLHGDKTLDAAFLLLGENEYPRGMAFPYPVFIHAVSTTLSTLEAGHQVFRINAWPGFGDRAVWEVCGAASDTCQEVLTQLGKTPVFIKDEPGMISARILAMIINEAYFALEDEVSSAPEIDLALQLGTNYPMGPVEWGKKIGLVHICGLLETLSKENPIYTPSALLKKEAAL